MDIEHTDPSPLPAPEQYGLDLMAEDLSRDPTTGLTMVGDADGTR